jgi:hypothetical protein
MGMASTYALSTDITLTEPAAEGASSIELSNREEPAGGNRADDDVAAALPETGYELNLFGEKIVQAKTPGRKRSPLGDGASRPSTALPSSTADLNPKPISPTESPSPVSEQQETPPAAVAPCGQRSDNLDNGAGDTKVEGSSLWASVPTSDLRGDDYRIESFASLMEKYPKDLKIYGALVRLSDARQKETRVDNETWKIQIGYSKICDESGCSKRDLGRAWPRLERLGAVVCIKKHVDRRENLYLVRSPEWLERMYTESRCTHYRFVKEGIQPFRPRLEGEK